MRGTSSREVCIGRSESIFPKEPHQSKYLLGGQSQYFPMNLIKESMYWEVRVIISLGTSSKKVCIGRSESVFSEEPHQGKYVLGGQSQYFQFSK
jgi:hypothetical protein